MKLKNELEPVLLRIIKGYDLPGLAVGIVKDNEIVYARGFGYKNIDTKEPITPTTLFHMASISKPFVATAIMQMFEQDKIDLNATIVQYLPYFQLDDDRYTKITIQQMLSHVSGMPDVQDYEWDKPQYDEGALERYVRSLAEFKMRGEPGAKFAYSNMAFECLGDVIGKVSGMSFAEYEKKYILDPAGMWASTFLKPEGLPADWAAPHLRAAKTWVWGGYPYNRQHGPSSTLHSNVLEMCRWAIVNINHGSWDNQQILDSTSYDLLWKSWVKIGAEDSKNAVGLSWFLGEYRGERSVSHSGGDIGFNTKLTILPDKATAVVVLCNFNPAPVGSISNTALDIILGFKPEEIKPSASIPVLQTLSEKGHQAAVELWNNLNQDFPDKYDLNEDQFFYPVVMAVQMKMIKDIEVLLAFCAEILSETAQRRAALFLKNYLRDHPSSKAAVAALEYFE